MGITAQHIWRHSYHISENPVNSHQTSVLSQALLQILCISCHKDANYNGSKDLKDEKKRAKEKWAESRHNRPLPWWWHGQSKQQRAGVMRALSQHHWAQTEVFSQTTHEREYFRLHIMVITKISPILFRAPVNTSWFYTDLDLFTIWLQTYGTYTYTFTEMNLHICCLITNMHAHVMKFDRWVLVFSRPTKYIWPCGQSGSEKITSSAGEECVSCVRFQTVQPGFMGSPTHFHNVGLNWLSPLNVSSSFWLKHPRHKHLWENPRN